MSVIALVGFAILKSGYFAEVSWTELFEAVARTTYRLLLAYGIALGLAVTLGLLVGWHTKVVDFAFPFFDVIQNIPSFALFPLFVYFFGISDKTIVLFAVGSILWPILFAILNAIKNAHKDLGDAARVFGATGLKRLTSYLAPLSFPAILTGSIVGMSIGWEAVIGAEIIASSEGFGAFIKTADASGISSSAMAGALAILVIVFVVNRLVWAPLLSESAKRYAE